MFLPLSLPPYLKAMKALAGVAQWIEYQPANQRVAGSIPSQDTFLGRRLGAWWVAHIGVSLPLFPYL